MQLSIGIARFQNESDISHHGSNSKELELRAIFTPAPFAKEIAHNPLLSSAAFLRLFPAP
jgi:hypothetical protein